MQQAEVVDLNDPEHQPQQTGSTSEGAYAIQPPAFGFYAISGGKQQHPKTTQGGYRGRHQKAGTPTMRFHHQARAEWPERRIWDELHLRLYDKDGTELQEGPILQQAIVPLRAFVAAPMRHGRMFLAGDAAHIVPPTGAKGLNLAAADIRVLSRALIEFFRLGATARLDRYSDTCLSRVWRSTHFSWWMTTMLHRTPGAGPMEAALQLSQLRYVTTSRAASVTLAENYVGYPPLR